MYLAHQARNRRYPLGLHISYFSAGILLLVLASPYLYLMAIVIRGTYFFLGRAW